MAYSSKAELLEAIRIQRSNIARVVEETSDRMEAPGAMGDWTMKDVIAHLTGWRQNSVARMEAAVNGGPPILPWQVNGDVQDYETINQGIYEQNRDRLLADVLMDSRESFDRLEAAVSTLDDADLMTPGRYSWLDADKALGPAVIGGTAGHFHEEHEADIRAFLDRV